MTTDASKMAVAASSGRIERPIPFASRQLNEAERAYSASELEIQALYRRTFLVRTDRAALTFLYNFADNSEFFLDSDEVLYRRQFRRQALLVIPETMTERVISMNHDSIFAAHPGPTIDDYVMEERRK
jgi:hypothetical protein